MAKKQSSFSQFDMGAGTAAARRGKKPSKVARKSPRNESRAVSRASSGGRAQEIVDRTRKEMKDRRRRTLRLGID